MEFMIALLCYFLLIVSPFAFLWMLWWLIKGARQSLAKRGILIALATWTVIGAWQWYQWDHGRMVPTCYVAKKDIDQARQLWQQHGIIATTYCDRAFEQLDYCEVYTPNYQSGLARQLAPEEPNFSRSQ